MATDDLQLLLDAFAKDVGIAPLQLDQRGTALLAFGNDQELIFCATERADRLQLWAPLHQVALTGDAVQDAALMKTLLTQNFPREALGGAYTALDHDVGVALLGTTVVVDATALDKGVSEIKAFAQTVMQAAATIAGAVPASQLSQGSANPGDDAPMIKA